MSKPLENDASVANQLAHRRQELGITQSEVAVGAGISKKYYAEIEHGLRIPPQRRMQTILNTLGFSEPETRTILQLAATERGLSPTDIDLPEEVQELIRDIRNHAQSLQPRFVKGLRTKIREVI